MKRLNKAAAILLLTCGLALGDEILPPAQPTSGPGGSEVVSQSVVSKKYVHGSQGFWLFEPSQPAPTQAPVVVFNHGWGALHPNQYLAWINHLVKRGNIVIYPIYQDDLLTQPKHFTRYAIGAVQHALQVLQTEPGHVRPDLSRFAIMGHSMGGDISANMAAEWKTSGLPLPRAVLCVAPGKAWGGTSWSRIELADLSQIPSRTLLVVVTGDRDFIVRDIDAKRIFYESPSIHPSHKSYVILRSDNHGRPALIANHLAALAWGTLDSPETPTPPHEETAESNRTLNALDFYGTWKLGDALLDAAFYSRNQQYAFGNSPEERFMGVWSDGTPVRELEVSSHP